MINILIPACGSDPQFLDEYWPKNVTEVRGRPMIQYAVGNYCDVDEKHFIFLLKEAECLRFHTDSMVNLLADGDATIIRLGAETGGALCTTLMAIHYIQNDTELVLANNDQKFDCSMKDLLDEFRDVDADCGVVTFECIHPRWSYVREVNGVVTEVAEKKPISKQAIAGTYYFRRGNDFIDAAFDAILKGRHIQGKYYLSAAVNEMILKGKRVVAHQIPKELYHTFYEPKQIEKYEREIITL